MRRKRIIQPTTRQDSNITDAESGDYCYYLNISNKVRFAKIEKTFIESDILCFDIMCQVDYKFHCMPYYFCSFDENTLKGQKRHQLMEKIEE